MLYDDTLHILFSWYEYSKSLTPPTALETLDLKKPPKWELKVVEPFGRCFVAKDDIKEGDVLFMDYPIITGPKQSCPVLCLGCYKQLDVSTLYYCSKCGWPMCSPECEDAGYHPMECSVYVASGYKPKLEDFKEENPMYESMLPLRCLLLRRQNPEKWKTLEAMESHEELRKGTELWQNVQTHVCEFLREKVKIEEDEAIIHRVSGILDVNCHEIRSTLPTKDEVVVRGVYPMCAMMSHDCCSNTHHTMMEDMAMLVVASRNIRKGQQITGTYTHLLSGTIERRKHLKYGKFFDCVCARCSDKTELGTYFSALRCPKKPCVGNMLPDDPLHPQNKPSFVCDECGFQIVSGVVSKLTNTIYRELQSVNENDPKQLEEIYFKYKLLLHPNHFHMINIKHSLGQIYGRVEGYLLGALSPEQTERKIQFCKDVLWVVDRMDPGISRLRGLTLYELHAPILLRINRRFQNRSVTRSELLQTLYECYGYLENTIRCLKFEPRSSFEGQIHKVSKSSADELWKWIKMAETLPETDFLPDPEPAQNTEEENMALASLIKKIEGY